MPCHAVVVVNSVYLYVRFYFLNINLFSKSNYGLFERELKKRHPVPAQKRSRSLRTPDFGRAGTGPIHARLEILCLLGPEQDFRPKILHETEQEQRFEPRKNEITEILFLLCSTEMLCA